MPNNQSEKASVKGGVAGDGRDTGLSEAKEDMLTSRTLDRLEGLIKKAWQGYPPNMPSWKLTLKDSWYRVSFAILIYRSLLV